MSNIFPSCLSISLFNWQWIKKQDRQEVLHFVSGVVGRKIYVLEIAERSFGYRKAHLNRSKHCSFSVKIDAKGVGTWKYEVVTNFESQADLQTKEEIKDEQKEKGIE